MEERVGFPLTPPAEQRNTKMMRLLVEHGVDFNATGVNKCALSAAIQNGDPEMLKLFLENGADLRPATVDEHESTSPVLEIAAKAYRHEPLVFLSNYRPDLYPDSPKHALHATKKYGFVDCFEHVLEQCTFLSRRRS